MADRMVRIVIAADVAAALRGLRDVEGGLGRVGNAGRQAEQQSSTFATTLSRGLAAAGVVGGIGLVVGGLQKVISTGLDYEKSMHTFQAVTGANTDVMKQMGDTAKALGNDVSIPGASAQTTAAAMTELAKGGLTAKESMDAARGTMVLAAAAQIDGAKAAEIQANALNTFGLKADQAGRVANVLANVANKSSGEISDFALGLSQAGTVANSFGWSIEDTTTMLGLMANAGIKGSDAGTSLKTTMTAMLNPTVAQASALEQLGVKTKDANGHMITAQQFTAQLTAAKGRMSDADFTAAAATAFGTDAVRTALVASQAGTKGYEEMAKALTNSTGAQDVAAANSQGLTGALDRLSNTASTAALTLYEKLAPALTGIVDVGATLIGWIGDAVGWFGNLPGPVQAVSLALGGMILLKGPLNAMFLSIKTNAIGAATSMRAAFEGQALSFNLQMTSMRLAAAAAGTSFSVLGASARIAGLSLKAAFLSNPIGIALVAVTTAISLFAGSTDDAAGSTENLGDAIDKTTGKLTDSAAALLTDSAVKSGAADAYKALGGNVSDLVDKLGGVPGAADKVDAVLKAAGISATGAATATGAYGSSSAATADILKNSATVTGFLSDSTGKLGQATKDAALTTEGMAGALGSQASATDAAANSAASATTQSSLFGDAVKAVKDAASEADTATQFLSITLLRMAGSNIDAATASRANEAAMRDIAASARDLADANQNVADKTKAQTDAINKFGADSPEAAAAARDLANANDAVAAAGDKQADATDKAGQSARDMAGDAYNLQVANGNLGGAVNAAVGVMEEQRKKFIDSQIEAGKSREEAEKLADAQGLIPQNVRTTYVQAGADVALKNATDLNAKLDALNNRIIRYTVVGDQLTVNDTSIARPGQNVAHAAGGWVTGEGGPTDDKVNIKASPDEFIVRASQAQKHAGLLEAINAGTMGFAAGGVVPAAGSTGASAAVAVQGAVSIPDVGAFQAAWAAIAAAVQQAWATIIQPALDALTAKSDDVGVRLLALQTQAAEPAWAGVTKAVTDSVDGDVLPAYAALNAGTELVGQTMWDFYNADAAPVWSQTGATINNTWSGVIAPAYGQLNQGSAAVGQAMWDLLNTAVVPAWTQIGSQITTTYQGSIVPAWTGVKGFASETGAFFTNVSTGVAGSRAEIISDLGQITQAINDFFKMVDGRAPAVTASVTAGAIPALADGGPITMGTGPRSDDVLLRGSKGEFMVNAASTAKHLPLIQAINNDTLPGFADGGLVGGSLQSQITSATQRAIEAGVNRVVASMTGGLSSATGFNASQDPSSFGWQRAAGIVPYSFQGHGFPGGVAGGTQGLWNSLLSALVPQIPGGLQPGSTFGFENRDNVNSPGRASFHSYGLALDVNAAANPNGAPGYGRSGQYVIPSGAAHSLAARLGMEWGGDFGGTPDPMHFEIHVSPDQIHGGGVAGALGGVAGQGGSWVEGVLAGIRAGGSAAAIPAGSGVERWRATVLQALGLTGQPAAFADYVLHQMDTESSGNPRAINLTDSNAQRGTPSKGLLQVIDPTFQHYRLPQLSADIYDPLANIVAAIRYVLDRYGSIPAGMQGHAYDQGGDLMPGWTAAFNGTGKREKILTDPQYSGLMNAALTPQFGSPVINVAAPQVISNIYIDGQQLDGRTEVIVDGRLMSFGQALNRMQAQGT